MYFQIGGANMKLPTRKTVFRVLRVSAILYVLYTAYPLAFQRLGEGTSKVLTGCFSASFGFIWRCFTNSIKALGGGLWDNLCEVFSWLRHWKG